MFRSLVSIPILLAGTTAIAQPAGDAFSRSVRVTEVPVTVDNFVRAATNIEMEKYLKIAGGMNRLAHVRQPTPVDHQPTIRMNRDTLYSMAVIDVTGGATLTVPDVGTRYLSVMIVNQDHYINKVFHGGGAYTLDQATFDTPFVIAVMRTLVDAADPADIKAVNDIQDAMTLQVAADDPFDAPEYNHDDFEHILKTTLELARSIPDSARTFGSKAQVDPIRHFIGTAYGWGGLPETEAFYLNVDPGLPVGAYRIEVPAKVPVGAFWSVSLYNADGYFQQNALGAYSVNSVTGKREADESMIVHLGACDDGRVNCLPIMPGWNYAVRMYQPGSAILDGTWTFPSVQAMD
ncbi:MAG: carboxylesterase [Rhodobacteraceae bacterium]|nr:carboxylesterase [Paracoccaceae bacterium]MAY45070.1 carboxylesterase [Paracoccaceae bacterium]QEW22591.1 hypothetical protein LA6_004823 [Marinibacterium anthonyi]